MKNLFVFTLAIMLLSSCGGGVEGDAQKITDLACEGMKFRSQGTKGEEGRIKSEKALDDLVAKMKEKYKDTAELSKLVDEKLEKACKAANPLKQ